MCRCKRTYHELEVEMHLNFQRTETRERERESFFNVLSYSNSKEYTYCGHRYLTLRKCRRFYPCNIERTYSLHRYIHTYVHDFQIVELETFV